MAANKPPVKTYNTKKHTTGPRVKKFKASKPAKLPIGSTMRAGNAGEVSVLPGEASDPPLFRVAPKIRRDLINESWQKLLHPVGTGVTVNNEILPGAVCVSTVEHDNSQLVWGRKGIPLCCYENECEALAVSGNQGPLHAYLTPPQQARFDTDGVLPDGPHFCLLCIRRDAHAMHMSYSAVLGTSDLALRRKIFVIPPFQNLVDVAGGYCRWAVLPRASFMPIDVSICGVSGTLETKLNPATRQFYIDQGDMVFGARDFR